MIVSFVLPFDTPKSWRIMDRLFQSGSDIGHRTDIVNSLGGVVMESSCVVVNRVQS